MNVNLSKMLEEFSKIEEVEGILLAGSHAVKTNDKDSDYDVYIYVSSEISVEKRKAITDRYCLYMELDNTFWEREDDGILNDGIPVEIIYRDLSWIEGMLNRTLDKFQADIGYTTCFWSNFINSIILYDKNQKLIELQQRYDIQYPKELKANIIKKNYPLLMLQMPAYYHQIEKALKRQDLVSVNHRTAAFFASYFDIIFAINEVKHPGEKKQIKIIKDWCNKIPKGMEHGVNSILKAAADGDESILNEIKLLVKRLNDLLKKEGLWYWE